MIKKNKLSRLICFVLALVILFGPDLFFTQKIVKANSFPDSFELTIDRVTSVDHKILKNPRQGSDFYETIGAVRNFIAYYRSTSGMVFYCSERGVHIKEYDYVKSGGEYRLDDDLAGVLSAWAYLNGWESYNDFLSSYSKHNDYVLSAQMFMWLASGQVEVVDTNDWIYKFWNAYTKEKAKMTNDLQYDFSNIQVGKNIIPNTGRGGYFSKHIDQVPIMSLSNIKVSDSSVKVSIDNKGDISLDVSRQALERGFTISLSQPRIDNHKLLGVDYVNKVPKYQRLKAIGGQFASRKNYEYKVVPKMTEIEIRKSEQSNSHLIRLAPQAYSLDGAEYKLYLSRQDAERNINAVETFITGAGGISNSKRILEGKYYLKEIKPPKNYLLNDEIKEVNIKGSSQIISVVDQPFLPNPDHILYKHDKASNRPVDKTLFELKFFDGYPSDSYVKDSNNQTKAVRSWIFETDSNGQIKFLDRYKKSGDELFKDDSGNEKLLMGTYTFREVQAKPGYVLDSQIQVARLRQNQNDFNKFDFDLLSLSNQAQEGQISITKTGDLPVKIVNEDKLGQTISRLEFINEKIEASVWHVLAAENISSSDGVLVYRTGQLVDEINSSSRSNALSKKIPLGKYRLVEKQAPKQFVLDQKSYEVNIQAPNQIEELIIENFSNNNIRKKVNISFTKNFEILKHFSHNPSAKIGLYLAQDYEENGIVLKKDTLLDLVELRLTDKTNSKVQGVFENIPIDGQFYIQEIQSSDQYQLNSKKYPISFNFENHKEENSNISLNETIENDLKRVSLEVYKKEMGSDNKIPVQGAEYNLYSEDETLGRNLIGRFKTNKEGLIRVDNLERGRYIIKETSPANDYLINPNEEIIDLSKLDHQEVYRHITQDEKIVSLKTIATSHEGKKYLNPVDNVTLVDKIELKDLIIGEKYTLIGSQIIKESMENLKDSQGNPIESRLEFIANSRNMTVEMEFTVNLKELRGKSLVTFEELYRNSRLVGDHKDIEDLGQTVEVQDPNIGTKFATLEGKKEIFGDYFVSLVDHVSYTGLVEGDHYTLELVIMDKSTGLPLNIDGDEIKVTHNFVAKSQEGIESVKLDNIDLSVVKGKDLVAFEKLYYNNQEIANHEDIEDKDQTVKVVETQMPFTGSNKIIKNSISASLLILLAGCLVYKNKNQYKERIINVRKK